LQRYDITPRTTHMIEDGAGGLASRVAAFAEYLQCLGASVSANVVDNSGAAPIISPVLGLGGCAHPVR